VPANKYIAAYIVAGDEGGVNGKQLREYLKGKLPEYMVPSVFVEIEQMPLTATGKVDRKGLPQPDSNRPETGIEFIAPRNEVEESLAAIWGDVLQIKRVGVQDNFFELGGHSLLATQVCARVCEAFDLEVGLRVLFEHPTIEGLGVAITKMKESRREGVKGQRRAISRRSRSIDEQLLEIDQLSDEEVNSLLTTDTE
jgi:hypothetical protein